MMRGRENHSMTTTVQHRLRPVSSRQNALVKELRQAFGRGECTSDGYCAIESVHLIEEAIRSGLRFRALFVSESAEGRAERLLPQIGERVESLILPDEVFSSAVAAGTPQGVAALVRMKTFALQDMLQAKEPLLVCAAGIQDPGNLGTILRSAEAFGANGMLLGEKTVSQFNSKAVRASAGSIFRLPSLRVELAKTIPQLQERGLRLVATSSHKGTPVDEARLSGALAVFIGAEGTGLPRELLSKMDEVVVIPHSPRVESLNAAVAAAVVLYEVARQRRQLSQP